MIEAVSIPDRFGWTDDNMSNLNSAVKKIDSLQESYFIHRHATQSKTNAESIVINGLKTRDRVLDRFTNKIGHYDKSTATKAAEDLFHNTHESRRFVVIIAIPKSVGYEHRQATDLSEEALKMEKRAEEFAERNVLQDIEDAEQGAPRKRVPPRYIVGYWDVERRRWYQSPYFTEQHDA